jgi:hypothetical protein
MAYDIVFILFFLPYYFYILDNLFSLSSTSFHRMSSLNWFWLNSLYADKRQYGNVLLMLHWMKRKHKTDIRTFIVDKMQWGQSLLASTETHVEEKKQRFSFISKNKIDLSANRNTYICIEKKLRVYWESILSIDWQILLYIWPVLVNRPKRYT